jgi:hypothetical protein
MHMAGDVGQSDQKTFDLWAAHTDPQTLCVSALTSVEAFN